MATLCASLTALMLAGCAVPIVGYAPSAPMLRDAPEISLVQLALAPGQVAYRSSRLALRAGRAAPAEQAKTDQELLAGLPSAALREESDSAYVPPYKFRQSPVGSQHYYNFTITPEFARATSHYLNGEGEAALAEIERILAGRGADPPTLLWQACYLKVNVLVMMGRADAAERETVRLEQYEVAAMGGNHTTRALRAEVKYWAGDIQGALEDASQVVRAFGTWRYQPVYPTPPRDQVELARCVTAHARASIVLGLALLAKGHRQAALPWLELASQTMNNVLYTSRHPINGLFFHPPEEVFWGRGMSLAALGTALLAIDPDSRRAAVVFGQAGDFFDALGYRAGRLVIEAFKAQALSWAGAHERAEAQARAGLRQAESLGSLEYTWRLEALRGRELLALQRPGEAEAALRRAQAVVDLMAGTLASDDAKVRFGIGKEGITRDLVGLDLGKGDLPALFEDMERGRARAFVALLANRVVGGGRGGALAGQIRELDRDIQRERQRKNALSAESAVEAGRELALLEQRDRLVARLRELDADLADALAVATVSLASVQAALPARTAMAYAVPVAEDSPMALLLATSGRAELRRLQATPRQFKALLDEFAAALAMEDGAAAQQAALARMADILAVAAWPRAESVYFVPSGHTHFVPWGGLDIPFAVAVLPNGGWIARAASAPPVGARAAIVGDPEFGGALPQLPGARREALAVAGLYAAPPLVGPAATEAALRRSVAGGVQVLHVASHALFDARYPLQSALILSDGKRAAPLTAEHLFAEPLAARLVVLSACETGMGLVVAGDELLGLTRSFYLGGASSMLSSLWPVEDEATSLFMETFHRELRGGSHGGAWRAARDAVRARGFPPSAYAAFVLGGSL